MFSPLARKFRSIWARLMAMIAVIVFTVWIVLAVSMYFFSQVQDDYSILVEEHIPRIALAGELSQSSAHLASVTTSIVGEQNLEDRRQLANELELAIEEVSALLNVPELQSATTASESSKVKDRLEQGLGDVLLALDSQRITEGSIAAKLVELRWLNADIQGEVEPFLSDYGFNIQVLTRRVVTNENSFERQNLVDQIEVEREARDRIQQLGAESATAVTLMIQTAVATDLNLLEQLEDLTDDALARVNTVSNQLGDRNSLLTLKQSAEALILHGQRGTGMAWLRKGWIEKERQILGSLAQIQQDFDLLQSNLSKLSEAQQSSVVATTQIAARRSENAVRWLSWLTVLSGAMGVVILFGYVRKDIVVPLRNMSNAMLSISDGKTGIKLPFRRDDEIGQMVKAVDVFQKSVDARDMAYKRLSGEIIERQKAVDDLKQTQAELVQAGKLAALGQLSSGISHELNQPLAAIMHRLQLLKTGIASQDASQIERQTERIEKLVHRMEATIKHLKRFARRSEYRSDTLSIGTIIEESLALLRGKIDGPGINLKVDENIKFVDVVGDQILIEQVVVNLLSNAVDAIDMSNSDSDGTIEISGNIGNKLFELTVTDNGVGLGDLSAESAFDPFVTTKEVGEGLGLGLTISYSIAKDLGGDLRLERLEDIGTRACLSLPLADDKNA